MDPALCIAIIVFCIITSAYFAATETAFTTFNRIRVKNLAEKGNKNAALTLKLEEKYDTVLSTILIANNIVNILASSVGTILFVEILKGGRLAGWSSVISTAALTVIILTFGEISPKTVAKKMPEKFAMFSAPLLNVLVYVFIPLSFLFGQIQNLLSKIFKSGGDEGITEEELISIVEEAEEDGGIDEDEGTLIRSAIEFNDLDVGDILTPRIDIIAVSKEASREEISEKFRESGFSRLPVYEGGLDNIVGVIFYKDFFTRDFVEVSEVTKPVIYVAKTQKINDLLRELQQGQRHLAVVLDEYGSTAGIVTLEDILEQIVGDIWDEHDEKIEELQKVSDTEYIVSGMASISKLFDELDVDEETEAQTVNGWTMSVLEKLPEVGDSFSHGGLEVEVIKTDGRRIEDLRVRDLREFSTDED